MTKLFHLTIGFALLGAALAFGLFFTPDNGKNRGLRLSMLLGFAFFSGLGMGPLLDMAVRINPTIVPNALLMSTMIFASFTGVALFAPDGHYLFLGGTLLSGLSTLFWLGLINLFFQSQLLFQVSHKLLSLEPSFACQQEIFIITIIHTAICFRYISGAAYWSSVGLLYGILKWSLKRNEEETETSSDTHWTSSLTSCKFSEKFWFCLCKR